MTSNLLCWEKMLLLLLLQKRKQATQDTTWHGAKYFAPPYYGFLTLITAALFPRLIALPWDLTSCCSHLCCFQGHI